MVCRKIQSPIGDHNSPTVSGLPSVVISTSMSASHQATTLKPTVKWNVSTKSSPISSAPIVIGIRPTGVAISFGPNMLRTPSVNQPPHTLPMCIGFPTSLIPLVGEPSDLPAINSWLQQSERTWNEAHVHLQRAVRQTKGQADRRRRHNPNYQQGQCVWLSTRDQRLQLPCKNSVPGTWVPSKLSDK